MTDVPRIREEIYELAKLAPDLETMHWYTSLDECFENNEVQWDMIESMKWRATVLYWKQEPVGRLVDMVDDIVKEHVIMDRISPRPSPNQIREG